MTALESWEARWAPYDEPTYQAALSFVRPDDIVLDIGAGDLRLARRMAAIACHVFAIERQPALVKGGEPWPDNLTVICDDARTAPWPAGITLGVLLMRHCTHTGLYVARLRTLNCRRLVTNARWRMGVELMELRPRLPWTSVEIGWYACTCGQVGFVPGPPEQLTPERIDRVVEVELCPACQDTLHPSIG